MYTKYIGDGNAKKKPFFVRSKSIGISSTIREIEFRRCVKVAKLEPLKNEKNVNLG